MKHLICVFALLCASSAHAGYEVCRELAHGEAQGSINFLISNAQAHVRGYEEFLPCVDKPLKLASETTETNDFGYPYFSYKYTVDCGTKVYTFDEQYFYKNGRCELRGD